MLVSWMKILYNVWGIWSITLVKAIAKGLPGGFAGGFIYVVESILRILSWNIAVF